MPNDIVRLRAIREDFSAPAAPPLDWEQLNDLDWRDIDIVSVPEPVSIEPLWRRSRWAIGAAAAVLVTAGSVMAVRGAFAPNDTSATASSSSQSTTGPTSLDSLADIAQNSPTPGHGDVRYLRLVGWNPGGNLSASSHEVRESSSEIWVAPDGSGRVVSDPPGGDLGIADGDYGPGTSLGDLPECRTGTVDSTSPNDAAQAEGLGDQSPAAAWMLTIATCAQVAGPIPGPAQATMLRKLAATDGVEERGLVKDKLGRTGYGFTTVRSNDYGDEELELILDPTTGAVLAFQILLVKADVTFQLPAINHYIAVEESAMVQAIGEGR